MGRGFAANLRSWFERHRRDLPWRASRDPYRIWVAEIMLQQTRAAAVVPYYERFLRRFPDVKTLARSRMADLLRCWSGLGYYSRARNLRHAARLVASELGGCLPKTYQDWTALPGVGPYTAAAVASIALGEPVAVLDGNVARVMARLTNHRRDVRSPAVREELQRRAQTLLDRRHPGDFNQAMMELGATVCVPRNPRCPICPVAAWCEARRLGVQSELPVKLGRREPVALEISVAVARRNGRILLRRRPDTASLMPGFWELPQSQAAETLPVRLRSLLGSFRHSITHHQYSVKVFSAAPPARSPAGCQWIAAGKLQSLPLTTISRKAMLAAGEK
jgi:A/G-specific adenine glycosylase